MAWDPFSFANLPPLRMRDEFCPHIGFINNEQNALAVSAVLDSWMPTSESKSRASGLLLLQPTDAALCQTSTAGNKSRKRKRTPKVENRFSSSSEATTPVETENFWAMIPKPVSKFFATIVSQLEDRSSWEWELLCNLLRMNLAYGTYGLANHMSATKNRLYRSIVIPSVSLGNFFNIAGKLFQYCEGILIINSQGNHPCHYLL